MRSPYSRRELLTRASCGFGGLALHALFGGALRASKSADGSHHGPVAGGLHHPARADQVIFLYQDGAPSQVDTFDPKPRLAKEHGQPLGMNIPRTQFADVGTTLRSPWKFRNYGESGLPVSDLFPHVGQLADELCVVRSMTSQFSEHTNANYFLHTGHGLQGRPSMGAWVNYGLGSLSQELPGYVVLDGGLIPPGGLDNFHNGFLPATHQGSILRATSGGLANLNPPAERAANQRRSLDLIHALDSAALNARGGDPELEAAIEQYELAFRMQTAVPGLLDLTGETEATRKLYGLDHEFEHTRTYGQLCLLARRLVERGVRFVEVTIPDCGWDRWDQHQSLEAGHNANALATDQPIAGLLRDLRARGLLERTLVVWAGEFGRTPMAQGTDGRDHNPFGYTIWLAGGGVRGGHVHGATDEYGYFAVQDKLAMYDLHATILHLLGVEHTQLTYLFSSREMRLTDVHGEVVHGLLA